MTSMFPLSARRRPIVAAVLGLTLLATGISCDSSGLNDPMSDRVPPTVVLSQVAGAPDSVLAFSAHATDNLGILTVQVQVTGAGAASLLDTTLSTTFTSNNTAVDLPYSLLVPKSVPPGTTVTVVAVALDGARNASRPDSLFLGTGNQTPALVSITSPTSADSTAVGFTLPILISGSSPNRVKVLGYSASGAIASAVTDSIIFRSDSLRNDTTASLTLDLTGASAGTLTLTPFLIDSLGRRVTGASVTMTITSTAASNTIPTVTFGITDRIEVSDTINVKAADRGGIRYVGYRATSITSSTSSCTAFSVADSLLISGNVTPVSHTFTMALPVSSFPCDVEVRGFARNQSGTLGEAPTAGAPAVTDTVTVVAGLTRGLLNGGTIADAIFHKATDNLYLTNIEQNEVEVFNLADQTFHTPVRVGSRPWGITVWPRDRDGNQGDTLLVANSGGTSISYIRTTDNTEVYRYPLPNFGVYTIASQNSQTGTPIRVMTQHEFSDRPQYLAATCRGAATPGTPCGDVILVYSTTPTPTQSDPFPMRGSLRWEDLTNNTSHFFFEQAQGQAQGRSDTLVVERYAAQGVGKDSILVPFQDQAVSGSDTAFYSVIVDISKLAFRDTTFARNSGNFARAIFGEGGDIKGSRALMYDATVGLLPTVTDLNGTTYTLQTPEIDGGISRPADVSDVIGNTATNISGASINFDGSLAAIRGDSTYLIDPTLRLQGLLQTAGGSPGFDFHPDNSDANAGDISKRVAFAASDQPEIQVYDTHYYTQLCRPIPIRDPIIGPIKAAIRPSTGDLVLVGATARGVVIVTLPSNYAAVCPQ